MDAKEPDFVYGDTPALARTGITDRAAAGLSDAHSGPRGRRRVLDVAHCGDDEPADWTEPSPHSDAYDVDDYSRPRNGLGTYHESDAAW